MGVRLFGGLVCGVLFCIYFHGPRSCARGPRGVLLPLASVDCLPGGARPVLAVSPR